MFALAITLPLAVMAGTTLYRYIRAERARLESEGARVAELLGSAVDEAVFTVVDKLDTLVDSAALQRGELAAFRAEAARALSGYDGELMLLDADHRDSLAQPGASATLPGALAAELNPRLATMNGAVISGLLPDIPGRGPRVAVALPVGFPGPSRALVFLLDPASFVPLLRRAAPLGPFRAALTDAAGKVIARSGVGMPAPGQRMIGAEAMQGNSGRIDGPGPSGAVTRTEFRRSPLSGWFAVSTFDLGTLNSAVRKSLWLYLLSSLALVGTASPIAWLTIRHMQDAMGAATDAAERIGHGQSITLRPTTIAEMNVVISAMAEASARLRVQSDALRATNQRLESRVAERTRELAASHALSLSILESSPDGIKLLDHEGHILFANSAFKSNFGADDPAFAGLFWPDLWPADGARAARDAVDRARTGLPRRFTAARRGVLGQQQWFDVLVTPLRDETGATNQILAISRDLTAHHLQEEELRRSKRRAEEATRAKTEFVADMSHELRAPLAAILAYTDLLQADHGLGEAQRGSVRHIESAAMALLSLAQGLLDVAKIESGEVALQNRPFALHRVIEEAVSMVAPSADAKGLRLGVRSDGVLPALLLGDPDRLRQAILNLLGNAIKFTPSGSVLLSAEAHPSGTAGCRMTIAVRDTGIGMSKEQLGLLFQRFSQNDVMSDPKTRGVGLGLAVSRRLIEKMGGTLSVESEPAVGSTFVIALDLPLVADEAAAPAVSRAGAESPRARVLLVEDAPISRTATRRTLERLGCEVDAVPDGEAALTAVKSKPYDLVLMDQELGGITGTQAARAIRELPHPMDAVPIVACSGRGLARDHRAFEAAGMNGRIDKPASLCALSEMLDRYVPPRTPAAQGGGRASASPLPDDISTWLDPVLGRRALGQLTHELAEWLARDPGGDGAGQLARNAHRLLSTASVLGLTQLAECCQAVEEAVGRRQQMTEAMSALRLEAERIIATYETATDPESHELQAV